MGSLVPSFPPSVSSVKAGKTMGAPLGFHAGAVVDTVPVSVPVCPLSTVLRFARSLRCCGRPQDRFHRLGLLFSTAGDAAFEEIQVHRENVNFVVNLAILSGLSLLL